MSVSRWRTPAAGVLSGLLLALAFPPHDATILLPLALVPWIVALVWEERRGRALLSGVLFGLAFWCASVPWISYVVTVYGGQPPAMGIVCVGILATILAEWTAAVGWGRRPWLLPAPGSASPRFPILWTAAEHARSVIYGGFPGTSPGGPWRAARSGSRRRRCGASTDRLRGRRRRDADRRAVVRRRLVFVAAAAAIALAIGVFGALGLTAAAAPGGAPVRVRLIQPNLAEEDRRTSEKAAAGYRALLARGEEAAAAGADLIVFPESAFPAYWEKSPRLREDLTRLSAACRCAILF